MTVSACLWLGLFPLLQFFTYQTITRDKWICMLILTGVTLAGFLADLFCRRLSRPRLFPLLFGGALLIWMILSNAFSPYTDAGRLTASPWWIGAGRREGLATQLCYLGLLFLFSCSRVNCTPVRISAVCGVAGFFIVVLLQRAGGNPLGLYPGKLSYATNAYFQGTIGHVDMGAGYLLIVSGLFLPAFTDALRRLLRQSRNEEAIPAGGKPKRLLFLSAWMYLLAFLICVYLIVTMDVQLGILTLLVLLVWTLVRLLPVKFRLPVLLMLMAAALVLVWFWPGSGGAVWELHEVLHGRPQLMFGSGRIGVWMYTLRMLKADFRPLFGSGTDTFALRFNTFLQSYYAGHPEAEHLIEFFDNPHCEYLAWIVNCGLPALFFFLVLVLGGCFGAVPWRDSILCYGIQALLSFSVCIVAPMFWVVLGMSYAVFEKKESE